MEKKHGDDESTELTSRLIRRIAELEERLYWRDLHPDSQGATQHKADGILGKLTSFVWKSSTELTSQLAALGLEEESDSLPLEQLASLQLARKLALKGVDVSALIRTLQEENCILKGQLQSLEACSMVLQEVPPGYQLNKVGKQPVLQSKSDDNQELGMVRSKLAETLDALGSCIPQEKHRIQDQENSAPATEQLTCQQLLARLQSFSTNVAEMKLDAERVKISQSAAAARAKTLDDKVLKLTAAKTQLEGLFEANEGALRAAEERCKRAEHQVGQLRQQVDATLQEKEDMDKECHQLRVFGGQIKRLEEELDEQKNAKRDSEACAARLAQESASLTARLQALGEQLSTAEGQRDEALAAKAEGQAVCNQLQQELLQLSKDVEDVTSEHDGLVEKVAALAEQLLQREADVSLLRNKLTIAEDSRAALLQEVQQILGERDGIASMCASVSSELQAAQSCLETTRVQLEEAMAEAARFEAKYLEERMERRKVHEQLQVLRGNIRVMCRVRPPQPGEECVLRFPLPGQLLLQPPDRRAQEFEFDAVFGPAISQAEVFEEVLPLVRSCADGYNVCIFAYGQTGSGKTHTMQGPPDDPGMSVRALATLFEVARHEDGSSREISVAMLEVYNETVRDLLAEDGLRQLEVSAMGPGQVQAGCERIPGLTWRAVLGPDDVAAALQEGSGNRQTAATAMNACSSRSHALLSVRVGGLSQDAPPSLLHLIDLAGSERVGRSEVAGQQLREAQSINKSLAALGDVVAALQRRAAHVPFRNSKLTQVIQDSLYGSSKVLLVCNLSPDTVSISETCSSLNFAARAAQVELGPVKRTSPTKKHEGGSPAQALASGGLSLHVTRTSRTSGESVVGLARTPPSHTRKGTTLLKTSDLRKSFSTRD